MIALLQRVNWAQVDIDARQFSRIEKGLVALLGIEDDDDEPIADRLLDKLLAYRVFADDDDKMNLSLRDIDGGLMLVSQFTLAADTNKGLRPSFSSAKPPAQAEPLYDYLVDRARQLHSKVVTGCFAANMQISLQNDGPVSFILKAR